MKNHKGTFKTIRKMPAATFITNRKPKRGWLSNLWNRFLDTFASEAADYTYVHKGVNDIVPLIVEYEVQSAISAAQTLTLTLPDHLDNDLAASFVNYVPIAFIALTNADPQVPVVAADLLITSHDRDTGTTLFTAANAGVPDDSVLSVLYIPATLGT